MRHKTKSTVASPEAMATISYRLGWAKRHGAAYNGIPYHDEIFSEGAKVTLYVPADLPVDRMHGDEIVGKAIKEVRASRDLISLEIMSVPNEWLEDSGWLNKGLVDRIVELASKQGIREPDLDTAFETHLQSKLGATDSGKDQIRDQLGYFHEYPPREKVKALIDAGFTDDQLARLIWGDEASWAGVKASYARSSAEIGAIWRNAGYELSSSGGDCFAAFKDVDGVRFMVADNAESSSPNPNYRLSVATYSAETNEHIGHFSEVADLAALETHIHMTAEELQPSLVDANEGAAQSQANKTFGPRR